MFLKRLILGLYQFERELQMHAISLFCSCFKKKPWYLLSVLKKKLTILSLNIAFTVFLSHSLIFKVLHLPYAFFGIYPVLYFLLLYFPNSFIFTFLLIDFYLCFTLYIFIPGDAFHPCCIYFGMY